MSTDILMVVPIMYNFKGYAELMQSVDVSVIPYVYNNWDTNDGVTAPWNFGVAKAEEIGVDYVFIVNDDTVFAPGTMKKMMDAIDKGYDLVTPRNTRDEQVTEKEGYATNPDFASFAITLKTIEKFGYFDENIHSYYNDNDYHHRIVAGGGCAVSRTDAGFYHHGSVTQNWGGGMVVTSPHFEEMRAYFISKWGSDKDGEKWLTPFNDPNKTVKDW